MDFIVKNAFKSTLLIAAIAAAAPFLFADGNGWSVNVGSFDKSSVTDMFPVPTATATAANETVDFNTNTGSAAEILSLHRAKSERDNDAGLSYMHAWDYDRAIACFEDALHEDPDNIQASFNLEKAKSDRNGPQDLKIHDEEPVRAGSSEISVTNSADSGWARAMQKALEGEVK